jgi:uncharacterized protein
MDYEASHDERVWGMLSYLLKLFAPVMAPLVIYFVRRDQSRFVAFHALQSLYLDLACIVAMVATAFLAILFSMIPFAGQILLTQFALAFWGLWVAGLIYAIVASVKAYNGEWFRAPLVADCAEAQSGPSLITPPAMVEETPADE